VNGELVPLRTDLRNGDRVEIITASHAKPNPGWLQYVRTGKARSNIRHFLKTMQYEESASLGERLLEQALKGLKSSVAEIDDAGWDRALRDSGTRSREELLADIGLGKRLPAVVARRLLKRSDSKEDLKSSGSVTIRGTEGMAVQLASCCRPIPGDAIVGSMKKGQGLVVHMSECPVIERSRKKEPEQWIDVEWDPRTSRLFQAAINVTVENQRGVLAKVASEIASAASNIDAISMDEDRALFTTMHLVLEVANRQHLARVLRALRRLPDVKKISRTRE
jgi:(p)ppGpp synthase/HD superfamily hydrolase